MMTTSFALRRQREPEPREHAPPSLPGHTSLIRLAGLLHSHQARRRNEDSDQSAGRPRMELYPTEITTLLQAGYESVTFWVLP